MTNPTTQPLTGRALIAAGGTGGHVYPALAVADVLSDRGWSVDWIGTERGIEQRLVPVAGLPLHRLSVSGLRGKTVLARFKGMLLLGLAVLQSLRLIRRTRPDVMLGMGGYAAGPAGLAAWVSRCPLVIHEQNAIAGTTNRWLAPLAVQVLRGLPGSFGARQDTPVVGNPVRAQLHPADRSELDHLAKFNEVRPLKVLVLGGSLGAAPLNALLPSTCDLLCELGLAGHVSIWQQCGDRNRAKADECWQHSRFSGQRVDNYIDDMAEAYRWADVVIARAGALTISELAATASPSVLIPLPHAIDDHQTANAKVLSEVNAAVLLPQSEATPERLVTQLVGWINNPQALAKMGRAAGAIAASEAAQSVADIMQEVARARG
ncbi:MAG: undecaprenyldiphospho-muramoylpentapeptide beta-N-acetylglucosaminyltransferase [Halieaceae bacterium]|nr:undecaprenyldiphospho-muramoylpentapeptide beta-N-acetylglucosaminyltransferase [Halieaceae bacterium]